MRLTRRGQRLLAALEWTLLLGLGAFGGLLVVAWFS